MRGINMRFWKYIGGVVLVIAGCSSFNRNITYITPQQQEQQEKAAVIEKKAADIAIRNVCPKVEFSKLPDGPAVPVKKWQQATDDKSLETAMMDHIEAQRQYIRRLQAQINRERDDYNTKCAQYLQQQMQNPPPVVLPSTQ
jgi:hypothetical protein